MSLLEKGRMRHLPRNLGNTYAVIRERQKDAANSHVLSHGCRSRNTQTRLTMLSHVNFNQNRSFLLWSEYSIWCYRGTYRVSFEFVALSVVKCTFTCTCIFYISHRELSRVNWLNKIYVICFVMQIVFVLNWLTGISKKYLPYNSFDFESILFLSHATRLLYFNVSQCLLSSKCFYFSFPSTESLLITIKKRSGHSHAIILRTGAI